MPQINLSILNQKATPAFFADTLANRPAAGFVGRIFVSTDTLDLYRDTGSAWVLLSPSSTGTIGGSGTTDTIPLFSSSSSITNSVITQQTGAQSVTIGSFATPFNVIGYGNYYGSQFIINGGLDTQILAANGSTITAGSGISISGGQISATATGITGTGSAGQVSYWSGASSITGTNNFFWDSVNNHLGINTNTPGTALDIHHNQNTIVQLNQTLFGNDNRIAFQNNGIANWRIGNFYNLGSNDFAIQDASLTINRLTIKSSSGQTFVGDETTSSGLFVVNNSSADAHLVVLGATAPSVRVRNAGVGASLQFGLGLATTTNNFIQGATGGEFCIFNDSLTAQPILFGIKDAGLGNTQEAARISPARNFLIGTTTDAGQKLQVNGSSLISGTLNVTGASGGNSITVSQGISIGDGFGLNAGGFQIGAITGNRFYIYNNTLGIDNITIDPSTGITRFNRRINIQSLPTSSAGLVAGDVWNNGGVLNIV